MLRLKGITRRVALHFNLHADALRLARRFLLVFFFIVFLLVLSAFLAWVFEYRGSESSSIKSFWDGIWWAVVTIATVGYGDKFPITYPGRIVGMVLIIVGFTSLSVFTGLIASLFVEDKLKGAKGLKQIRTHNHVVICGWNNTGDFFLRALIEKQLQDTDVCILANEAPEFFERLEAKYPGLPLSFVRGEATHEESLHRAAVEHASQVIILADQALSRSAADDRSIIVANAVHYLAKKEKITVQLINTENRNMLQRIGITNIIIWDDIGGYILANNVFEQDSLSLFCHLAKDPSNRIMTRKIGDGFIGKSFGEYFDNQYKEHGKLIIGLMNKVPELESASIFADDSTGIDQFIKAALAKSKRLVQEDKSNIRWNPARDSIIQANDHAIYLG
jgi:voltage-gated potassium channel